MWMSQLLWLHLLIFVILNNTYKVRLYSTWCISYTFLFCNSVLTHFSVALLICTGRPNKHPPSAAALLTWPLRLRYNGHDSVSNHQLHGCLLNCFFRCRSKKHQSSASLAFVWGIHQGPVNSLHKWPVTRKMFPFDDVIMTTKGHMNHVICSIQIISQSLKKGVR